MAAHGTQESPVITLAQGVSAGIGDGLSGPVSCRPACAAQPPRALSHRTNVRSRVPIRSQPPHGPHLIGRPDNPQRIAIPAEKLSRWAPAMLPKPGAGTRERESETRAYSCPTGRTMTWRMGRSSRPAASFTSMVIRSAFGNNGSGVSGARMKLPLAFPSLTPVAGFTVSR